jgi:hypothetical protein
MNWRSGETFNVLTNVVYEKYDEFRGDPVSWSEYLKGLGIARSAGLPAYRIKSHKGSVYIECPWSVGNSPIGIAIHIDLAEKIVVLGTMPTS